VVSVGFLHCDDIRGYIRDDLSGDLRRKPFVQVRYPMLFSADCKVDPRPVGAA
jgi:hypothetical protein